MIFNIVGILIGALIAGGAGFYLVKSEKDAESKKINTIGLIAGLAILAFAVVRTVFFS
jgi:membrane protein DedA with SNARE-associated domain